LANNVKKRFSATTDWAGSNRPFFLPFSSFQSAFSLFGSHFFCVVVWEILAAIEVEKSDEQTFTEDTFHFSHLLAT